MIGDTPEMIDSLLERIRHEYGRRAARMVGRDEMRIDALLETRRLALRWRIYNAFASLPQVPSIIRGWLWRRRNGFVSREHLAKWCQISAGRFREGLAMNRPLEEPFPPPEGDRTRRARALVHLAALADSEPHGRPS